MCSLVKLKLTSSNLRAAMCCDVSQYLQCVAAFGVRGASLCNLRVAVCCSVLQCLAVCCSVLQFVAVCCSVLQCVTVRCSVLQFVAVCCSVLYARFACVCERAFGYICDDMTLCCSVLQCVVCQMQLTWCSVLHGIECVVHQIYWCWANKRGYAVDIDAQTNIRV